MSTYTQDITHLIGKINTNLPDNDTQAITAARIRDAMGAVAYNYDLYVLKSQLNQELGSYVLKTDLDAAGYVTASALSGYVTQDDLQTGMQSVLDDSYAYVVKKINEIPGVDLSAYVTKTELSEMGYITSSDLPDMSTYVTESQLQEAGYATKTYVADYVATHTGPVDLSAYVTKDELSAAGYLTAVPSEYITDTELSGMGYITSSDLPDMSTYATKTYVADYVATHTVPVDLSAYVTKTELSEMGYLTSVPSEYITDTELSGMGYITSSALGDYVTETELSQAGYLTSIPSEYITDTELSNVLSTASYVTQNELLNAGYITNLDLSQASYVTQQALSAMGYITSSDLPDLSAYATLSYLETYYATNESLSGSINLIKDQLIAANVLVTDPETGDLTPDSMASQSYVAEYVSTYAPMPDLSSYVDYDSLQSYLGSYVTKTELSAAGYLTAVPSEYVTESQLQSTLTAYVTDTELSSMGYITSSDLPDLSAYVTKTELSNMSYATTSDLTSKQDTLVSGTNIKTINNESILGTGNITITGGAAPDYSNVLTFTNANGAFSSTIKIIKNGTQADFNDLVLQYSTDNGETWNNYTLDTVITLGTSTPSVKFKGINEYTAWNDYNYHQFVMTGRIGSSGDLTSLLNEFGGDIKLLKSYTFNHLFEGCTALLSAPKLPSTTLSESCYYKLFYGCTALVTAPKLPATTLASYCYIAMFYGCTSLKNAPELPAMKLPYNGCYYQMFRGCTALTKAPELPATALCGSGDSYREMFYGCTALKDVPEILPATTLYGHDYERMFYNCTALTKAPDLPGTTLVSNCYKEMFYGCTNLKYVKAMFTTTPSNTYTQNWLYNVSSTGTFVKSSTAAWTAGGESAAPLNWTKYKAISIDTDDMPESYVEDEGMTLQVVNGRWTKVTGGGGDTNVIESVSVNGTALTPDANKNVDITVPTNTNELTNGAGFITSSSIPSVTVTDSGAGNAVTAVTASGHTLTVTKGSTFLTSANLIYDSTTNTLTINV